MNRFAFILSSFLALNSSWVRAEEAHVEHLCSWSEPLAVAAEREQWFANISRKLSEQRSYRSTIRELKKQLQQDEVLACRLVVNQNGDIAKLEIQKSSGSPKVDESILSLVQNSAPFRNPPISMPFQRNVIIEFQRHGHDITPSIALSRLINGRIGAPLTEERLK